MAVLCLLTNTPWPWPTPAEAASARGGFLTLGTEWRRRSEAEVCTSEARKIRVPLARARGRPQEGLVSLLGAERMRSHFVVAVAMGPALRAGTRLLRNSHRSSHRLIENRIHDESRRLELKSGEAGTPGFRETHPVGPCWSYLKNA
jgi:hypothetical protein